MAQTIQHSDSARRPLGHEGQLPRRLAERGVRRAAVAFARWGARRGLRTPHAAACLGLRPRTLRCWARAWERERLPLHDLGRPRPPLPPVVCLAVQQSLEDLGPGVGLPTLRGIFPAVPRSRLGELQAAHRRQWHEDHALITEVLCWHVPGTVWAADFTEPPNPVDGLYEQILAARDLGSSYQLLWLPTPSAEAQHACDAIEAAFRQHGAPLVAKSDQGSPFTSDAFQSLLDRWNVVALLSPPYTPWYNGAIEAGNGSHGTRTHYEAARHGHPGYWTSDDLEAARLQSNTTARPWGARGPTPQDLWTQRPPITPSERQAFRDCLEDTQTQTLRELGLAPADLSDGVVRAAVARAATRRALETLGYLCVRRKRITPPFNSHLRHIIT